MPVCWARIASVPDSRGCSKRPFVRAHVSLPHPSMKQESFVELRSELAQASELPEFLSLAERVHARLREHAAAAAAGECV
jgi:hypothetical protein